MTISIDTTVNGVQAGETNMEELKFEWQRVAAQLQETIGDAAFQSWIKPISVRGLRDGMVRVSVPTRFMRDWVVAHYSDRITELWKNENDTVQSVDISIFTDRAQKTAKSLEASAPVVQKIPKTITPSAWIDDLRLTNLLSVSQTNLPMPPPVGLRKRPLQTPLTRYFYMAVLALVKHI